MWQRWQSALRFSRAATVYLASTRQSQSKLPYQRGRSWFWTTKRPVARQAGGLAGSMSSGISMAVVAVDRVDGLDGALAARRRCGRLVSQCGKPEPSDART